MLKLKSCFDQAASRVFFGGFLGMFGGSTRGVETNDLANNHWRS